MRSVASTNTDWMMLGRISRVMIASEPRPDTLAASTYSWFFSASMAPRTRRKNSTQLLKVSARIRLTNPGPIKAIMPMAKIR